MWKTSLWPHIPLKGRKEFKSLAPSHFVAQNKDDHSICFIIDYTNPNHLFSKAASALRRIQEKVIEIHAYRYVFGLDIFKQYHQVLIQQPLSQCLLHRESPNNPLYVNVHILPFVALKIMRHGLWIRKKIKGCSLNWPLIWVRMTDFVYWRRPWLENLLG